MSTLIDIAHQIKKVQEFAIEGLLIDGAHHKQWYLEKILESIGVDLEHLEHDLAVQDYFFKRGITP